MSTITPGARTSGPASRHPHRDASERFTTRLTDAVIMLDRRSTLPAIIRASGSISNMSAP